MKELSNSGIPPIDWLYEKNGFLYWDDDAGNTYLWTNVRLSEWKRMNGICQERSEMSKLIQITTKNGSSKFVKSVLETTNVVS